MEDIKELPDFDDVLSLYGKQKSDFAEEGGGNVDFVLSDSIGVKEKMKIFSASVLSAYNSGEEADPNTVVRDTECYRESLLDIGYGLVDESIPLFMTASKFFLLKKCTVERRRQELILLWSEEIVFLPLKLVLFE